MEIGSYRLFKREVFLKVSIPLKVRRKVIKWDKIVGFKLRYLWYRKSWDSFKKVFERLIFFFFKLTFPFVNLCIENHFISENTLKDKNWQTNGLK